VHIDTVTHFNVSLTLQMPLFRLNFYCSSSRQSSGNSFCRQAAILIVADHRYAQIGEKTSPDGSKRSIIFGEKDDGVDEMRHVKIVAKDQKFDPNSISPSRTKYPWEAIPAFEFSILRPLELKIAWTDNNNLDIVYPVDDDDTITFQRPKSVSSDVQIHPSAKEK